MYEIKRNERHIPGGYVSGGYFTTYQREVVSANILEVEAGTTGFCGGDSRYGCRTYFRIKDLSSTDIHPKLIERNAYSNGGFEVVLGGDCELETIIGALKFIVKVLEDQKNGIND